MSSLKEYIKKVKRFKEQNPDLTENELVRYVYYDLGKKFSFNLKYSFGSIRSRKKIYSDSFSDKSIDETMETNTGICVTFALILESVLSELGVDIITANDLNSDEIRCIHVYNIIKPKQGERYSIDLQEDLENIQSHSFTSKFGRSTEQSDTYVISRKEQEEMDKKLGFISDKEFYADEYLDLLRSQLDYFTDFGEKMDFLLTNIEAYNNTNINYIERFWYHNGILRKLLSDKEFRQIRMVNFYTQDGDIRNYILGVAVINSKQEKVIYLYNLDKRLYEKKSMREIAQMVKDGLQYNEKIPGLSKALKELEEQEDIKI